MNIYIYLLGVKKSENKIHLANILYLSQILNKAKISKQKLKKIQWMKKNIIYTICDY